MNAKKRSNRQRRVVCGRTVIILVVLTIFGCSQKAFAQWNTNGNDISNSSRKSLQVILAKPGTPGPQPRVFPNPNR